MARFLLLLSPASLAGRTLSPGELGARTVRFMAWIAAGTRSGVIRSGGRLTERWAVLTRSGAEVGVAHGHVTPRDRIAGYFVIEADDLDAATALAGACPGANPGTIEVLELDLDAVLSVARDG